MSNMLKHTRVALDKHQVFDRDLSPILNAITSAIPFHTVPKRMKLTIAVSEVVTFASQFRRNIVLDDGTSVPINSIAIILTGSGENKDSSVRAARKCFKPGYDMIESQRKAHAHQAAKDKAQQNGEESFEDWEVYKQYYQKPPPIFMAPTTGPGFIQHINDIAAAPLGSGLLYAGEYADELSSNGDMMENTKILSETYDLGEKEVKYTKGVESRSEEISGQPVSALFVTSPVAILYDEIVKNRFNIAILSKLGRRSHFCYSPEKIQELDFEDAEDPIEAFLTYEENIKKEAKRARDTIEDGIKYVTEYGLSTNGKDISVSKTVSKMFLVYKRYNSEVAQNMHNQHSAAVIVRKHLQWKALKLAGAIALFDMSDEITEEHYAQSIRFCEMLADDMGMYEAEAGKFAYEKFADYMATLVNSDGEGYVSIHDMKKRGFITSTARTKLQEFLTSAQSYDTKGIYELVESDTAVQYKMVIKTDAITLSYKPVDNTPIFKAIAEKKEDPKIETNEAYHAKNIRRAKEIVASGANSGYETGETTFPELGDLLAGDFAYSPFIFRDNYRDRDNVISGTKVIVFDIDDSHITYEECHFMMEDLNHHIALSSDPDNIFKFRLIVELDSVVDVDVNVWKHFYQNVGDALGLNIDPLAQSALFFSYSTSPILSTVDGSPLEVRDHLIQAVNSNKEVVASTRPLSTAQQQAMLSDRLTTFSAAFDCANGSGSREMIRAAYKAKFLGMPNDEIIDLMHEINRYWLRPMDEDRLQMKIISQIERWN